MAAPATVLSVPSAAPRTLVLTSGWVLVAAVLALLV